MDLTYYRELQEPFVTKKILTCTIRMDKKTILEALLAEIVIIKGYKCKVPEHELLMCLYNRKYGELKLDFEIIE